MLKWNQATVARCLRAGLLCGASFLTTACGSPLHYGSESAAPLQPAHRVAFAGMVDGRFRGAPSEQPLLAVDGKLEEDLAQLRRAVDEHLENAGLSTRLAAPRSRAEVDAALRKAAAEGQDSVVFLRLRGLHASGMSSIEAGITNVLFIFGAAPGLALFLVTYSTPNNTESAGARVEALVADPETGLVRAQVDERVVVHDDAVTYWGYGPQGELDGVLFECMESVLAKAVAAAGLAPAANAPAVADLLFPAPTSTSKSKRVASTGGAR